MRKEEGEEEPRPSLLQASDPGSRSKVAQGKGLLVHHESGSKMVCPPQPQGVIDACADGSLQCIR